MTPDPPPPNLLRTRSYFPYKILYKTWNRIPKGLNAICRGSSSPTIILPRLKKARHLNLPPPPSVVTTYFVSVGGFHFTFRRKLSWRLMGTPLCHPHRCPHDRFQHHCSSASPTRGARKGSGNPSSYPNVAWWEMERSGSRVQFHEGVSNTSLAVACLEGVVKYLPVIIVYYLSFEV